MEPVTSVSPSSSSAQASRLGRAAFFVSAVLGSILIGSAIYTSGFGTINFTVHRAAALILSVAILIFGGRGLAQRFENGRTLRYLALTSVDVVLLAILTTATWRFFVVLEKIEFQFYSPDSTDVAWAIAGLAVLLEIGRRVWGAPLLSVCLIFLIYLVFGHLLPDAIGHRTINWSALSVILWYGYQGVFSTTLGIVLNVVVIFVLFGNLLESTGAGRSLIKFSLVLTGRLRGGPAHAAIVASSMFGTMSGSTVANVVGTGTFTIPMIKQRGFSPTFAGGIEATASSGGQIVPPIMGAAAFVMADVVGVSYLTVATAALIPALLYYFNLFLSVSFEARKQNIQPMRAEELPRITLPDLLAALQFVVPIITVITLMIAGRSVAFSGFAACVAVVAIGLLVDPDLRRNPRRILNGVIAAGRSAAGVIIAVAMIGIIIGTMDSTGTGLKFASFIGRLAEGNLFLSLVLAMLGALLLGMGMPTLAAYLIIALVLGPSIEIMGISILAAHLFVFYYGVASSITPPVALAAYAAAPIAGSDPFRTGVMAVRLGMAKFLVPFVFVYNPVLLLVEEFEPSLFLFTLARSVAAFWLIASALTGFDRARLAWWEVVLRFAAGILLLHDWQVMQASGLTIGVVLTALHWLRVRARDSALVRAPTRKDV